LECIFSYSVKFFVGPVFSVTALLGILAFIVLFGGVIEARILGPFLFELANLQEYLSEGVSEVGSAYDIGEFTPTIGGFLEKIPVAISFTLYRPFIWESSNVVMLLAALESSVILGLTIYALLRTRIIGFFAIIMKDRLIFFCILFTILFAIPIGIASGNYGTLVRYKIPCLPFYLAAIFMIINYRKHARA